MGVEIENSFRGAALDDLATIFPCRWLHSVPLFNGCFQVFAFSTCSIRSLERSIWSHSIPLDGGSLPYCRFGALGTLRTWVECVVSVAFGRLLTTFSPTHT